MNRQILNHATLVLPSQTIAGAIVLSDGKIEDVLPGRSFPDGLDLSGHFLAPGIIDLHTDYLERELNPRPDTSFPLEMAFHMMDVRAVACGLTTVLGAVRISSERDGPLGSWNGDGLKLASEYPALTEQALARHLIHVRWNPCFEPCEEALARLAELRPVIGNLVFNDSTPGERQFKNTFAEQVRRFARLKDITVAEAERFFEERRAQSIGINNRAAVQAMFGDGRLPLGSHDDTTVEHVEEAHTYGATLAEMPVSMEAAVRARELGLSICMGAPNYFRGGSHCGNLSAREAYAAGLVDMLCSDYHFPSLLACALQMMESGIAAHEAFRLITLNPVRHLGLAETLGSLEVGKTADVIAFRPVAARAKVTRVWIGGELVYSSAAK